MEIRHKAVVEAWFDSVIKDGGTERLDDLHVDEIDTAWRARHSRIAAAIQSFETAVEIRNIRARDREDLRLGVLLSIPLEGAVMPIGVNFHTLDELEKSLSYIPPSLYLLASDNQILRRIRAAEESGSDRDAGLTFLDSTDLIGRIATPAWCLYSESKGPEDEEYSRHVYLVG